MRDWSWRYRFQRINEFENDCFETSPEKTLDFCIYRNNNVSGKNKGAEKTIIEKVTENSDKSLGIRPEDVFIVLNDPPLENWGMRGKQLV